MLNVRAAVGPEGQVVPQQRLVRTSARYVDPADRRRLDLIVVYGATPLGEALCCDVMLVSPLTREGQPRPFAATRNGGASTVAERRKRVAHPELLQVIGWFFGDIEWQQQVPKNPSRPHSAGLQLLQLRGPRRLQRTAPTFFPAHFLRTVHAVPMHVRATAT